MLNPNKIKSIHRMVLFSIGITGRIISIALMGVSEIFAIINLINNR